MTDDELLDAALTMTGNSYEDSLESLYIPAAKAAVVSRMFPFDASKEWADVPERHHLQTARIAVYLLDREGAEGETTHSENGTSRTWGSADVPAAMFGGIVPFAGVPS